MTCLSIGPILHTQHMCIQHIELKQVIETGKGAFRMTAAGHG